MTASRPLQIEPEKTKNSNILIPANVNVFCYNSYQHAKICIQVFTALHVFTWRVPAGATTTTTTTTTTTITLPTICTVIHIV